MPHDGETSFSYFSYGSGRRSPSSIKTKHGEASSSSRDGLSKEAKKHAEAYTRYDESVKSDKQSGKESDYKLTTKKDKT